MPDLPKRMCNKQGCTALVSRGYCDKHTVSISKGFHKSKYAYFYNTREWRATSKRHRAAEPLCRRCKVQGIIRPAALTHHSPALIQLLQRGLNPYDDTYLESLCVACHNNELVNKRK